MIIKNDLELEKLKEIGKICAKARDEMAKAVKPGVTTLELDIICKKILDENGAISGPMGVYNFPGYSCISVNEVCAHGIPSDYVLSEGDYVNVDVSASKDGYFADTGMTVIAGKMDLKAEDMLRVSFEALINGINAAKPGKSTANVGKEIFKTAIQNNYTVLRNLTGHGVGLSLHEEPHYIFNYNERRDSTLFKENMVVAIETFISDGDEWVEENEDDSWPLFTENNSQIVQFEHTVVVRKEGNIIITESENLKGKL